MAGFPNSAGLESVQTMFPPGKPFKVVLRVSIMFDKLRLPVGLVWLGLLQQPTMRQDAR